jgi:hypothetical protein
MQQTDLRSHHAKLLKNLQASLLGNDQRIRIKKKTVSNLFRYEGRTQLSSREIDLRPFDKPLYLDPIEQTLEVQGLTTYERIVDFTLPLGFLPTITPELKHITIGGATVGIGIETNSYRYGFVHDGLLEAEVLLPNGEVVVASPDNKYSDLFYGLPNSYGTLGYILRVKIQLRPVKPYVELHTERFTDYTTFLRAMYDATNVSAYHYIESLIYSANDMYLVTCKEKETVKPTELKSIYGSTIFYKEISRPGKFTLTTKDYIFRYDPEWFWAIPESSFYKFFRSYAPRRFRNSGFYSRYVARQKAITTKLPFMKKLDHKQIEQLIQDWEVPWAEAEALLTFATDNLDLPAIPLMAAPLKSAAKASCYPIKNELYLNLGSYNYVRRKPNQPAYYNTKLMDGFCFKHQGIKMLYSTTFLDEKEFNRIYNGKRYAVLKQKYDPKGLSPTLFEKAVRAR